MKCRLLFCLLSAVFFFACGSDSSTPTTAENGSDVADTFTDPRDGQVYRIVSIDNHVWMTENLNYATENSQCYSNDGVCLKNYGRYYAWGDAMTACPEGWHLPSANEFGYLPVGNASSLKTTSGWYDYEEISGVKTSGNGTDDYGFSALPAGYVEYFDGAWAVALVDDVGYAARFWTSDELLSPDSAEYMSLDFHNVRSKFKHSAKKNRFSVRCIQGHSANQKPSGDNVIPSSASNHTAPNSSSSIMTMTDFRDGQVYKFVGVGTLFWMAQNLNYETSDSYCYGDDASKCALYGRLYPWSAATNACPEGWHLPSKAEFESLIYAVGGDSKASKALRSTTGWSGGNGSDTYGFSALPAGKRKKGDGFISGDTYDSEGTEAYFWSSTESSDGAYYLELRPALYFDGIGDMSLDDNSKNDVFSVRCVMTTIRSE